MDIGFLAQFVLSGVMLGVVYAMVAVGFTLYFGVLDVINFSHADVLTAGAFLSLATYLGLTAAGVQMPFAVLALMLVAGLAGMAALGMVIAKFFVLPLRHAPPFITLLMTLMLGTAMREAIRLFYPSGSNPQSFPKLLPKTAYHWGNLLVREDTLILIATGIAVIALVSIFINRTRLGLAIRAVAQDGETARIMGIHFEWIVLLVFALGSALASAVLTRQVSLADGVFAISLLLGLQYAMSTLVSRFSWVGSSVTQQPTLLVRDGRMLREAMKKERVTDSEVLAAIRKQGIDSVQAVAAVVLETDGSFSVIRTLSACPSALEDVEGAPGDAPSAQRRLAQADRGFPRDDFQANE